ncbi:MAG: SGNH/GDSL hydrolase family protein, partial [Acidimicrobiia bacterium]|nr:SGNH/GDSL hydrolase family protein [Acidimicrobiia bacterium]
MAIGLAALLMGMGLSGCEIVKPVVLVYGDSLTFESLDYIVFLMGDAYDVRVDAMGGTALCDYQERMISAARSLRPKLVISTFSGNAATACMKGSSTQEQIAEKYRADVDVVAGRLSSFGVPLALVTPPPVLRPTTTTAASDQRVPAGSRFETWAETGIDTETDGFADQAPTGMTPAAVGEWRIGEIPSGFRSETHPLDGVYRQASSEWRARGAAVGVIDGFSPFATTQGSWTKVQPCGSWEVTNPLCRNGLIDVRSADLGHFCPSTASYDGIVPKCSTYSPGALRWAAQMSAYVRFIDGDTIGHLDAVVGGPESVSISGWAIDPSLDVSATQVHVYVDSAGTALTAAGNRPDVGRVFPVAGARHGFTASIPAAPGSHSVCVYAINLSGPGSNPLLGCRTVQVTPSPPFGFLDLVAGGRNLVTLSGWAADPKAPRSPIDVSVRIGTSPAMILRADLARPDVARVLPALGSIHGFAGSIEV